MTPHKLIEGDLVTVHKPSKPINLNMLHKIYKVVNIQKDWVVCRTKEGGSIYLFKDEVVPIGKEKWFCSRHQLHHGQKYISCKRKYEKAD